MEATLPHIVLRSAVFDCPDPSALARFYGQLLGGTVTEDPDWSEVRIGDVPFKLAFQRVDGYVPPEWPDGQPQQVHVDFTVSDLTAASTRWHWGRGCSRSLSVERGVSTRCMPIRPDIRSVLWWS